MNVEKAIRAAQERLHRAIGQWGRHAHAAVARKAQEARAIVGIVNALGGRK